MPRHSSRIELSLSALRKNIKFLRSQIGEEVQIASVVKANAYGHGIEQFVPMIEKCGIHYFAVASSYEADEVFQVATKESHIVIMGILYPEDLEWVIENQIEFYVFDYERLVLVRDVAQKMGQQAIIHLEVETGANRTGLPPEDFTKSIKLLRENQEHLRFKGLCTHLAGAETLANNFRISKQIVRYQEYLKKLKKLNHQPEIRHIASSAGAMSIPEARFDMVRIGISQYGQWPGPDIYHLYMAQHPAVKKNPLSQMITWKTDVNHVKEVQRGEFIGYGLAYEATRNMRLAVIPLGYSNGYGRSLSNNGYVLIHGKKAPICGLVNMNLFMVDITHLRNVKVGDEVVLIGRQNNNKIEISSFSEFSRYLNAELVSRLPAAIPREVVK